MYNMDDLVLRGWVGHGHLLRWNREFLGHHIYIKSNVSPEDSSGAAMCMA